MKHHKGLYFGGILVDVEALKANDPTRFAMLGMYVYVSSFFQALLRHGTYDTIFLPTSAQRSLSELSDVSLIANNQQRLKFVSEHELQTLQQYTEMVFVTPSMELPSMARLRRISGCRHAPITGVIHSINHPRQLWTILQHLLSPLESFDAVICSSSAGRRAMTNFIALVRQQFEHRGWPALNPIFQMPVIPTAAGAHASISFRKIPLALRMSDPQSTVRSSGLVCPCRGTLGLTSLFWLL